MAIRNKVLGILENRFHLRNTQKTNENILDRTFKVLPHSIRTNDYDDAWLLALSLHHHHVIDVGCNMGQSSMLILYSEAVKSLVLIDPNPSALAVAAENIFTNGFAQKVRFICNLIGDQIQEKKEFFTVGTGAAGSIYLDHAQTAKKQNSKQLVNMTTLDQVALDFHLTPDLIKVDVEGAEGLVLNGSVYITQKYQPKWLIEMHSSPALSMAENAKIVLDWCSKVKYQAWYLAQKSLLTNPEPISKRGRCHLLLIPENVPFPRYLQNIPQGASLDQVQNLS